MRQSGLRVSWLGRVHWRCFFFFSSRRRHTRSKRDWSSDVCSSDLSFSSEATTMRGFLGCLLVGAIGVLRPAVHAQPPDPGKFSRSEERRVGKEGRYRWWPDDDRKDGTVVGLE